MSWEMSLGVNILDGLATRVVGNVYSTGVTTVRAEQAGVRFTVRQIVGRIFWLGGRAQTRSILKPKYKFAEMRCYMQTFKRELQIFQL